MVPLPLLVIFGGNEFFFRVNDGRIGSGEMAVGAGVVAVEELAGVGAGSGGNFGGAAVSDHAAAVFAAFGAEVKDPVGVADYVEIVLDDDDGVAEVGESVKDFEELADVVEVEAGGGLV